MVCTSRTTGKHRAGCSKRRPLTSRPRAKTRLSRQGRSERRGEEVLDHVFGFTSSEKPSERSENAAWERRVLARRGRAGEKSDFFSILLEEAMTASVVWGLTLLEVLSPLLARAQQILAWKVIA